MMINITAFKRHIIDLAIIGCLTKSSSSFTHIKFKKIANIYTGDSTNAEQKKLFSNKTGECFPYVATKDISMSGSVDYENGMYIPKNNSDFEIAKAGSVLLCIEGGNAGNKIAIIDRDVCFVNKLCCFYSTTCDNKYLYYYLQSNEFRKNFKGSMTGLIGGVSIKKIKELEVPIPSIEEQRMISNKVETVFAELDKIDINQERLLLIKSRLSKLVLDHAIKGKLVDQNLNEGTGEELYDEIIKEKQELVRRKLLKKDKQSAVIDEDEIPFQIPSNWKWCRVSDVCYKIFAGGDKPSDFVLVKDNNHQIPVVANGIKNDGILGYTSVATANKNSITIAGRGTIGFSVYRTYDFCPIVRLVVLEQSRFINPHFLQYVLSSLTETGNGTSIPQLTVPMLSPKLIPLPPRKEQDRIVDKAESILSVLKEII